MSAKSFLTLSACLLVFYSCKKNYDSDPSSTSSTTNSSDVLDSFGNLVNHEASSDYTWDTTSIVDIQLNETSITVNKSGATASGSTVTISTAGTYRITGSLTDGQILVNASDTAVVRLLFNNISVTNTTTSPVYVKNAEKVVIVLPSGTTSTINEATASANSSSDDDVPNAAIYSKSNLTIYGDGSLTVTGKFEDGIASKDGLIIRNATVSVTSVDDGIRGKDYLVVNGAKITVDAKSNGLKSDNESDAARGFIQVLDGTINVTSTGDAIIAKTDVLITKGTFNITAGGGSSVAKNESISTKGIKGLVSVIIDDGSFTISTSDDGIHTNNAITINGGTFSIASGDDGMHADASLTINAGTINITKSVEGVESKAITVNSGSISIVSSDDCFNATAGTTSGGTESSDGSLLTINGGTIAAKTSTGDGLDSNGSIVITGGTILVNGPGTTPNLGMDYNGSCKVSGGFLIASGIYSSMTQAPSSSSSQYSVKIIFTSSYSANTLFHIQDASGNDVVTFKPSNSYNSIIFSSSDLKSGSTYSIYTGGSSTGTLANGLYQGGTYTPGTVYKTFAISSMVTTVGSSQTGGF